MQTDVVLGAFASVRLTDRFGNVLPLFWHNGRYYVQANDLQEYRIQVQSHSPDRLEVLTAIDGRNTLCDETANIHLNSGMVVSGRVCYEVKGWRMSDSETRPFVFTAFDEETVANQATGSSRNLGVIAVAVYREYKQPPMTFGALRGGGVAKGGLESSPMRSAGIGTGMGSRLDSDHVGHTTFERATYDPDQVVEIYAMPKWWLEREGVLRVSHSDTNHPSGFPGSSETGYRGFKKIG